MVHSGSKQKKKPAQSQSAAAQLTHWQVQLEGEWSAQEAERVLHVFHELSEITGGQSIGALFNGQATTLHHSGRPGRVGWTRGSQIYLDGAWTDWTLAHELGHRWNNAWDRQPERTLRKSLRAGRWEWLKRGWRQFEKWLERTLKQLNINSRLDWRILWYHPGDAPPPCGVDRNFNASEDLAESFAAAIFQDDAQSRARKASERSGKVGRTWNWPLAFAQFSETQRGQVLIHLLKTLPAKEKNPDQPQ